MEMIRLRARRLAALAAALLAVSALPAGADEEGSPHTLPLRRRQGGGMVGVPGLRPGPVLPPGLRDPLSPGPGSRGARGPPILRPGRGRGVRGDRRQGCGIPLEDPRPPDLRGPGLGDDHGPSPYRTRACGVLVDTPDGSRGDRPAEGQKDPDPGRARPRGLRSRGSRRSPL
ncbi:MAG: hypothetical protein MZU97_12450 [Bacillus subtilis]|nr:hypothetical protein [Bacillus subtilis]